MAQASRTFRIFVSSPFSDLKAERNALQERVWPVLQRLCLQHGARFQAIDLRWGVSEEAALDQRTMTICLDEIERCRRVTPRPNFVVLLGDRYGWRPPPPTVPGYEWDLLVARCTEAERELLESWYLRDDNAALRIDARPDTTVAALLAVPETRIWPEYVLKPREGEYKQDAAWRPVEQELVRLLMRIAPRLPLETHDHLKYAASATEQEIRRGALRVEGPEKHVHCFFRRITNRGDLEAAARAGKPGSDFLDLDATGKPDTAAQARLEALKAELRASLPDGNVLELDAQWVGLERGPVLPGYGRMRPASESAREEQETGKPERSPITLDHLYPLCAAVYRALARTILAELGAMGDLDSVAHERLAHWKFGRERATRFTGRDEPLARIAEYRAEQASQPLVVYGPSGSGKSALMAEAARHTVPAELRDMPEPPTAETGPVLVQRFIGATPSASEGRALLDSLCHEVSRLYGEDESSIPTDYRELVQELPKRLGLATAKRPLVVFLDALDQLSDVDHGRGLFWLPTGLPEYVRLIVSVLPREGQSMLARRLPAANVVELQPMRSEEGRALLVHWLYDADRTLQADQRTEVLDKFARSGGLPLYLKLAFEEARRWKSYTDPGKTVLSEGIQGIIRDNLFNRLEAPANHRPLLVARSLGYLAAAKNGLTEDELLDVVSRDDEVFKDFMDHAHHKPPEQRLPVVVWSRLYFDLEPYLTERSADGAALLGFYHRQLRQVVEEGHLRGPDALTRHRQLADYFVRQPLEIGPAASDADAGDDLAPSLAEITARLLAELEMAEAAAPQPRANLRKLSELPYQQTMGELWEELFATLTDFSFQERKAATGAVERTDGAGNRTMTYSGVYQLQDDYELALEKYPR